MGETTFEELTDLPRAGVVPSSNGRSHDELQVLPGISRHVRSPESRAVEGFNAGRQVSMASGPTFSSGTAIEQRPYGRTKDFIESLEAIIDFDPQASQAVWNFQRLLNPGHEVSVFGGIGKGEKKIGEGPAQDFVNELIPRIFEEYGGGLDKAHDVMGLLMLSHGAIAAEIAPNEDLRSIEDFYPINPLRLSYKRVPVRDGDKIGKLTLGQQPPREKWEPVNPLQVFYGGLDPKVDVPYGRPPLMSALMAVMSKSQMLNDLRAVAHNQGYPRIDVKVLWEALAKAAPAGVRDGGRDKDLVSWMQRQLTNIAEDYNALKVDDTFVHYDWVDVGMVGPNYAATSFDFKGLEVILSRQINSALKTLPILLGYNEATSETHGSIQWQIQVEGIIALRKIIKRMFERMFDSSLRLAGFPFHAKIVYKPIRTVDRKFEAEAAYLEAKTFQVHQTMGWADGDEIAQELYGHDSVAEPVFPGATGIGPGAGGDNTGTGDSNTNTDTGGEKTKSNTGPDDLLARILAEDDRSVGMFASARAVLLSAEANDIADTFAVAAGVIFRQAKDDLIAQLEKEGLLRADAPEEARNTASDIADYVFGLRFSRAMKRLLREAIIRGMEEAGASDATAPELIVDRIWRTNLQYVRRIKEDLKSAIRSGEFRTLEDVNAWFARNAYREELMGRFLSRQGYFAGWAYQREQVNDSVRFTWHLNPAEHCADCPERDGQTYTYGELLSVGFPGSINLACAANCKCSISEEVA